MISNTFDPLALLDTSLVNTCINEQGLLDCTQRFVLQLSTDTVISLCHDMLPTPGSMQGLWYALAHSTRALLLRSWFYTTDAIRYMSLCIHIKISRGRAVQTTFLLYRWFAKCGLIYVVRVISVPFLGTFAQSRQVPTSADSSLRIC